MTWTADSTFVTADSTRFTADGSGSVTTGVPGSVGIPNHSFHLALTNSGQIDSRYENGITPSTVAWATVPSFLHTTAAVSVDVRATYLSGTGASTATLALVGTVSGWALVGDKLTFVPGNSGTNSVRLSATLGTATVYSNFFILEGLIVTLADTTAPTFPPWFGSTVTAKPSVILNWGASSDVVIAGSATSGLAASPYQITKAGANLGGLIASKDANGVASVGIAKALTAATIGTVTPAISAFTQTGSNYSFTAGGDSNLLNWFGLADSGVFANVTMTGDFTAYATLEPFTATYAFAKEGLMWRATLDADSAFLHITKAPDLGLNGLSIEWRGAKGGIVQAAPRIPALTGSIPVRIRRVAATSTVIAEYWDGSQAVTVLTIVIGSTDPTFIGITGNSGASGQSANFSFTQFGVQTIPGGSFEDTAVSAGTNPRYGITAKDAAGNLSASNGLIATIPPAGGGGGGGGGGGTGSTFSPNGPLIAQGWTTGPWDEAAAQIGAVSHVNVMASYPGGGFTFLGGRRQSFVDRIKSIAPSVGPKVIQYFILDHANPNANNVTYPALLAKLNANPKWFAWVNGITRAQHVFNTYYDAAAYQTNWATAGGTDSNGLYFAEWFIDMVVGIYGPSGAAVDAVTNMDGYFNDNYFTQSWLGWDYNASGTQPANTDANFNLSLRQGLAKGSTRLKNLYGKLAFGNVAGFYANGSYGNTNGLVGALDGGWEEGMFGSSFSVEHFAHNTLAAFTALKANVQYIMAALTANKMLCIHHNVSATGTDEIDGTPYQAARYVNSFSSMDQCLYMPNGAQDATVGNRRWFNEQSADPNTGVCFTWNGFASSVVNGIGYMGQFIDQPWTVFAEGNSTYGDTADGIYYRRRVHPVTGLIWLTMCAPSGRGPSTINVLGRLGKRFKALSGGQAPTINNGATVNFVNMGGRDGRFGMLI